MSRNLPLLLQASMALVVELLLVVGSHLCGLWSADMCHNKVEVVSP